MLGPNSDNYWFSGFKTVSYQGSGTVDATVGVMPQSTSNGVVTGGWSNLTPFNTINIQQSWSPHWCSSYELVDDTWMSDWIPQNTQPDWRYSDTHQPDDGSTTGYRVEQRRYHHIVWSQHWHHHSTPSQHNCCGSFHVEKEPWFKFDAGSNTSASHTWEWEQDIKFAQDFPSTIWTYGVTPMLSSFAPINQTSI